MRPHNTPGAAHKHIVLVWAGHTCKTHAAHMQNTTSATAVCCPTHACSWLLLRLVVAPACVLLRGGELLLRNGFCACMPPGVFCACMCVVAPPFCDRASVTAQRGCLCAGCTFPRLLLQKGCFCTRAASAEGLLLQRVPACAACACFCGLCLLLWLAAASVACGCFCGLWVLLWPVPASVACG
jgi:hypothetical protein